jgi:hypothetical protein
MATMIQVEERPKDAAERARLTKEAITEGHRRMILQIAETWRLLLEQREQMALTRGHEAQARTPANAPLSGRP